MTSSDHPLGPRKRLPAIAWIVSAIALLGVLSVAIQGIAASSPAPAQAEPAATVEFEEEAEFEEEWEFEENEGEEEGEEEEAFGASAAAILPAGCLLRSAQAHVVAIDDRNSLQLTVNYTSEAPAKVTIDYWLKGGKGSLQLGKESRRIGAVGSLQLSQHLDDRAMSKVNAARTFIVELDVPAAPSYCDHLLTRHLSAKHALGNRATWSEPLQRRRDH